MITKKLPAHLLKHTYEQYHRVWFVQLPPGYEFDDLFSPGFWTHHRNIQASDLVRVRHHSGAFDFTLSVIATPQGGAVVDVWPRYPTGTDINAAREAATAAAASRPKIVPISPVSGKVAVRVEFHEATKWRVIALDGSQLSQDHATEADAEKARDAYLKTLGMELPSAETVAAAVEGAKKRDAERKAAARPRVGKAM